MADGKGVKALQNATLGMFVMAALAGALILAFFPDKMGAFRDLVGALFPFWVVEVVPAFLGTSLKEATQAIRTRLTPGGSGE